MQIEPQVLEGIYCIIIMLYIIYIDLSHYRKFDDFCVTYITSSAVNITQYHAIYQYIVNNYSVTKNKQIYHARISKQMKRQAFSEPFHLFKVQV